jgi:hypothetical protein
VESTERCCWVAAFPYLQLRLSILLIDGCVTFVVEVVGHFMAKLDPLGLDHRPMPVELDPSLYGFTEADLDRE